MDLWSGLFVYQLLHVLIYDQPISELVIFGFVVLAKSTHVCVSFFPIRKSIGPESEFRFRSWSRKVTTSKTIRLISDHTIFQPFIVLVPFRMKTTSSCIFDVFIQYRSWWSTIKCSKIFTHFFWGLGYCFGVYRLRFAKAIGSSID